MHAPETPTHLQPGCTLLIILWMSWKGDNSERERFWTCVLSSRVTISGTNTSHSLSGATEIKQTDASGKTKGRNSIKATMAEDRKPVAWISKMWEFYILKESCAYLITRKQFLPLNRHWIKFFQVFKSKGNLCKCLQIPKSYQETPLTWHHLHALHIPNFQHGCCDDPVFP